MMRNKKAENILRMSLVMVVFTGIFNTTKAYPLSSGEMPVKITSFTAVYNTAQKVVNLRWATSSEKDNERFIVERSLDSLHFTNIGETRSAGNNNTIQHYYFDDSRPVGGKMYYRLRQIDKNGKQFISTVISAYKPIAELEIANILTSPYKLEINFAVISPKASSATVVLADVNGKVIKSFYLPLEEGTTFRKIYIGDVKPGIYFLQVNDKSGGGSVIKKFVKK